MTFEKWLEVVDRYLFQWIAATHSDLVFPWKSFWEDGWAPYRAADLARSTCREDEQS